MIRQILAIALATFTFGAFAAVDVNKASQAELEAVKGIGTSLSARIVDARKAGAFKDWSDLRARVKGVGERKAAKLSGEGLTVGGTPYAAAGK